MAQILRVSIFGSMPGGEKWSVNPCWEIDGSVGKPVSPTQANTIATAIAAITMSGAAAAMWATNTVWTGVRVEARSLTGGLESQAEVLKATPTPGTGSVVHPYQTALVLSLLTPGIGPSSRGRLYTPATGVTLGTADFRVPTVTRDNALAGWKAFLLNVETAINTTIGPNANLTVWSRKTAGFHDVNQLRMGNVVDTQRRRRDTLIEGYGTGTGYGDGYGDGDGTGYGYGYGDGDGDRDGNGY